MKTILIISALIMFTAFKCGEIQKGAENYSWTNSDRQQELGKAKELLRVNNKFDINDFKDFEYKPIISYQNEDIAQYRIQIDKGLAGVYSYIFYYIDTRNGIIVKIMARDKLGNDGGRSRL